ncbi:S8 family serine peptidase [Haloprofundus salilacus]|uniref:S8 family serine peptidase n=1 Tax=Haloprofundus salilacus TaxID=2876190 RepID=UPI001CCE5A4E|nr:S8 family serine peptidase [Haloprofundus salilacus]
MTENETSTVFVVCLCVLALTGGICYIAVSPQFGERSAAESTPSSATVGSEERLHRLHGAGLTGENVTVGIVDVTEFDRSQSNLSERVVVSRTFESDKSVGVSLDRRSNTHGTSVASIVARTAPDSKLYLATVDSPEGYERAVEWFLRANVDIVVTPVSFYGKPGDGSSRVARLATRATERGVVFVAPDGNLARGQWSGRYQSGRNESGATGVHQFGNDERNYLRGDTGTVTLWLSWDDAHRNEAFTAELYRTTEDGTRLVARSQPYTADTTPNERLTAHVGSGTYFVVVRGPRNETTARVTLESSTHGLQFTTPERSVTAPATGQLLSVGAYDQQAERLEPFSSRGPTDDGRLGVDVVAPSRHRVAGQEEPFVGTSAAAAYVGGVAALLLDADPTLEPWEVERRLERTATDVGKTGIDTSTGYGRVEPVAAVGNGTVKSAFDS